MRALALLVLPLSVLAAACGSSNTNSSAATGASSTPASPASSSGTAASVATRSVGSLGTVLVNGQGRTLYLFMPEKGGKVKCTGSCASLWPALKAGSGTPSASGGAHASMISTAADPAGGSVVTYNGWPLHTYASDSGPGSASGQGIEGKWYVISPSGNAVTKKASSSSSSSGGYGGAY